jgi:hypothetical protein
VQRSDYGRVSPLIMREAIILRVKLKSAQQLFDSKLAALRGLYLPARFARLARMAGIVVPASASATAAAINFGTRFIHGQRSSTGIFAVQSGNGLFRFIVVRHFHETKAA